MRNNKPLLFLIISLGIGIILVIILIISSLFNNDSTQEPQPISSEVKNTSNPQDTASFEITPLQKTIIGKTEESFVKINNKIISTTEENGIKTYVVQSFIRQYTNEIKTENGIVVFESTRTDISNPPPPTISAFKRIYGEPELVLNSVSSIGKFISAYIYAEKGYTLFANRYTGTVYDVHRYLPMTLSSYQQKYTEYLQEAPPYPQERPDEAN